MAAESRDDAIHVAIQHPGGVGDGFPDTELDILLRQGGGGAAKPCDPHLEGDAGAVGGFLEEHGNVPTLERAAGPPALLDLLGKGEHVAQLLAIEVCDVEKVTPLEGFLHHERYAPGLPQASPCPSPGTTRPCTPSPSRPATPPPQR